MKEQKMNLERCDLCPRRCGVNRAAGETGYCGAGSLPRLALVSLHRWEEPCLTGDNGAGTVFFSHCTMKCLFCQNYQISCKGAGIDVSVERLSEIFMEQQRRGAASLDLVTPTHYAPQIIEALGRAKKKGFSLPVVYNCGGYELPEAVEALRGWVDVFLPDLKYCDDQIARRYSHAPDYFKYASASIEKMFDITGPAVIEKGIMRRGVLVRHLILPGQTGDSKKILDYLHGVFGSDIYVSLMNQYTPMPQTAGCVGLNRRLTTLEYHRVLDYAESLGMENCYIQKGRTAMEKFIPRFDGCNVVRCEDD